jgi:hypothetical protein
MSSDRTGAVGKAATAAEDRDAAAAAKAGSADHLAADQAQLADPWFAPGPKDETPGADGAPAAAAPGEDAASETAAGEAGIAHAAQQAEWFMPTGRAGLLPDSMTVAWDQDDAPSGQAVRVEAAGAPPWAGETADALASAPPPWDTGPWPGPGVANGDVQADGSVRAADGSTTGSAVNGTSARGGVGPDAGAGGASLAGRERWSPRTVLTAGLIPLIVPGLVVGVLSLRHSAGPAVRRASWLAIAASLAWAVIIILIVAGTSGGSASSCGSYPAAVHQAYEKALTDLADHAPASVQAADLGTAANRANDSAAAAGQIGVRTALFAMANDMAQARADVVAQRPVPATLSQHLIKDGAAPAGSCPA